MALAIKNLTITDEEGNVVSGATVTVRDEATGRLARLFSDRDGTDQISNPFTAGDDGHVQFHVQGGAYSILARKDDYERQWRYEPIGTAQEVDVETLAASLEAGTVSFRTKDDLDLFAPEPGQHMLGAVQADPDPSLNGYYTWDAVGEEWEFARPFPETLARLVNINGSANARTADAFANTASGAVTAFFGFIDEANTGPMTLSINGEGARPVVNAAGNPLSSGEFQGGVLFFLNDDGDYQLINDAGASASAAQSASDAKDEADRAEGEADRADAAADRAENSASSFIEVATNFKTVAALLADETIGYAGSGKDVIVGEGDIVTAQGFRYEVAASGAVDAHVETAGGVRLNRILPPQKEFQNQEVNIIAHRGFVAVNMQNTMMAFADAMRWTRHLETDVSVSADGTLYLFHDTTVDALTSGTGTFTALSDATINTLTFNALAGTDLVDLVRIPTFADFLTFAARRRAFIWPEMKALRTWGDVDLICQTVLDAQMDRQCVLQSFNYDAVARALDYDTRISCGWLLGVGSQATLESGIDLLSNWGGRAWLLAAYTPLLAAPSLVSYAEARGVQIGTWTVPNQTIANQLVAIGVRNIMTDYPLNRGF